MPEAIKIDDDYLETARKLVIALEQKDQNEADVLLNHLNTSNHMFLFQEIGKLTRYLHDTLRSFETDLNLTKLAEKDIPDATNRLKYVIEKTDEAASNTLTIVEKYMPICEAQEKESQLLESEWSRFMAREMNADDFRSLASGLTEYFTKNKTSYSDIRSGMSEIIIAQDYQDITGQIIKKVIDLVQNVENNLIRVIKISGEGSGLANLSNRKNSDLEGPQVPDNTSSDAVNGQDEVDDLLSSLGF